MFGLRLNISFQEYTSAQEESDMEILLVIQQKKYNFAMQFKFEVPDSREGVKGYRIQLA